MTELDYVVSRFGETFEPFRGRRIVLHGSRDYAREIAARWGESFGFLGLMSQEPVEGDRVFGLPLLRGDELAAARVDLIVLTERVRYEEEAYQAVRPICREHDIALYNMYGVNERCVHAEAVLAEHLDEEREERRCRTYDLIAFEAMDTVLCCPVEGKELYVRPFFQSLIPALRAQGKELRFSLRKSVPEAIQIEALRRCGLLSDGERELLRREGEDLGFRRLRESVPNKRMLYYGHGLVHEFLLPRCYGIDTRRWVEYTPAEPAPCPAPPPLPLESIREKIREKALISFDIFDTLLCRQVSQPRDVFAIVESRARQAGYPAERFAALRERAEGGQPGCTIDDIYELLGAYYGWPRETEAAMKALELETERELLAPRPAVVEMLHFAQHEGKRVVLTSDMYLPGPILRSLLAENGIEGYEALFVSCECGRDKRGGLFRELLALEAAPAILHIGDQLLADCEAPAALGIESAWIPPPICGGDREESV